MRSSQLGRATALAASLCAACQFDSSPAFSDLAPDAPATTDATKSLGDFGEQPAHTEMPGADDTNSMNNAMPPAMSVPDAATTARIDAAPAHDAGTVDAGSVLADAALVVMDAAADAADQDADDPELMLPEPGTAYAPCGQSADCNSGLVCSADVRIVPTMNGVSGGYCMALCTVNANQTNLECLQPKSGTVQAQCDFNTSLCALGSCEHAECPDGTECVDSSTQTSSGYVIHIFECVP